MNIDDFIKTLNEWGRQRVPFLFIVDFEMQKPLAFKMAEIDDQEILFEINGVTNVSTKQEFDQQELIFQIDYSFNSLDAYRGKFNLVKHHLGLGNSFLANLTVKTKIETNKTLQELFFLSKARYKLWYRDELLVYSPEIFVQIKDQKIYSYPMKGTIDAAIPNAKETILKDEKELAEHVTIVDLIRNDLSMVAESVQVTKFRYVEEVATNTKNLLQVSSEIRGNLKNDYVDTIGSLIFSLLPAGSISGAPKKKTLEIIKNSESDERGYYTGVFGYFDGENLDVGVMIRFIEKTQEGLFYRSGEELPHRVWWSKSIRKQSIKSMPRFIETIKLLDGEFCNINYHQSRLEFTFSRFFSGSNAFNLRVELNEIPRPMLGLFKCRVTYEEEIDEIIFQPYSIKPIHSLKLVEANDIDYHFKFANRDQLNKLHDQRQSADDVIIVKNGMITDSTYSNLIFKRDDEWITPESPLLPGTMRQKLIDEGKIKVERILMDEINKYEKVKLINSMLEWEGPEVEISRIV